MKNTYKTFLALTAGVMSLASCAKLGETGCPFPINDEIRFANNGVRVEVKSFVEADNTRLQTNGFKVAAIIDADNSIMFNSAVAYDSGDAVYRVSGSHYYFPAEGTMSFYGVYPATQAIAVEGGVATLSYSQNADTDLVAAKAAGVARQSAAVRLSFGHLLSQVSIKAQGENASVDYKLKSVRIAAADGGTYAFADDSWTPGSTTAEYTVYSDATGMAVSTGGKTDVGSAMSFVPGTVSLNVVWECYNKGTSTLVSSNSQSVNVTLEKGKRSTLNLTLPSNSSDLSFVTSVGAWVNDGQDIVVKPKEFVFTVNAEGKKVKFSPGNLYWDGSKFCFEESQLAYLEEWDPNHVGHFFWSKDAAIAVAETYSDDSRTTTDSFFATDGGAISGWTVLSSEEWQYLIENSLHTKIRKDANLYYAEDGDWGFYGTEAEARAAFNANTAVRENFEGKSFDELLESETIIFMSLSELYPEGMNIRGIADFRYVILKPDGFSGEIKESYTASEWAAAEADGLVCLPAEGNRNGSNIYGTSAHYWSSTPGSSDVDEAYNTYIDEAGMIVDPLSRDIGYSVRLVQVVK